MTGSIGSRIGRGRLALAGISVALVLLGFAWVDGGRESVVEIAEPLAVPQVQP